MRKWCSRRRGGFHRMVECFFCLRLLEVCEGHAATDRGHVRFRDERCFSEIPLTFAVFILEKVALALFAAEELPGSGKLVALSHRFTGFTFSCGSSHGARSLVGVKGFASGFGWCVMPKSEGRFLSVEEKSYLRLIFELRIFKIS